MVMNPTTWQQQTTTATESNGEQTGEQYRDVTRPTLTIAQTAALAQTSMGWVSLKVKEGKLHYVGEAYYPDRGGRQQKMKLLDKAEVMALVEQRELEGRKPYRRKGTGTKARKRRERKAPLSTDAKLDEMERLLVSIRKDRERERKNIEQEVKARLMAALARAQG